MRQDELRTQMQQSSFWDDIEKATKVTQEEKNITEKLDYVESLSERLNDIIELSEITDDEEGKELYLELVKIKKEIEDYTLLIQLNGEYDRNDAVLNLHVGVGGNDAQDFTEMLLRMYMRWATSKGYKSEILNIINGDEAGIREATVKIIGEYAYGFLKAEKGIHRLVRISPFNSNGKRQTSFASVEVTPVLNEDQDITINPDDLKIDTFRSGGAGGQHVNTTDSAVRITHIPTGIVVQCQNERSQNFNKEAAMEMLKSKLAELKEREKKDKIDELTGELKDMSWGGQIRSYVFNPYQLVKDHRTLEETTNVNQVLDGDIDLFINAYLKNNSSRGK